MVGCGGRLRGRAEGLAKVREACCYLQSWMWSKQKLDVVEEEGGCGRRRRWMLSEKKVCETDGARVWYNWLLMAKEPLGNAKILQSVWTLAGGRFLEYLPVLLYFLRFGSWGFTAITGGRTRGGGGVKAGLPGWMPASLLRRAMRVLAPSWGTTWRLSGRQAWAMSMGGVGQCRKMTAH